MKEVVARFRITCHDASRMYTLVTLDITFEEAKEKARELYRDAIGEVTMLRISNTNFGELWTWNESRGERLTELAKKSLNLIDDKERRD